MLENDSTFDIRKFDREVLGLSEGDWEGDDTVQEADFKNAIESLTKVSSGEGGVTVLEKVDPAQVPGAEIPDYLSAYKEDIEAPLAFIDEFDYKKEAQNTLGIELKDATYESFQAELIQKTAYDRYIEVKHPDFRSFEAMKSEQMYPKADLVRRIVTDRIYNSGIVDQETIDKNVSAYFEDGVLNKKGLDEYLSIQRLLDSNIDRIKESATSYAKEQVEKRKEAVASIDESVKGLKVFGVEIPEDMSKFLGERAKQQLGYQWLNDEKASKKELANRALLLELVSSPVAFTKFIKQINDKGIVLGENKVAKSKF